MPKSRLDPSRGFVGGYEMETLPGFGLAGVATNTIPGAWGVEYAKIIEKYDQFAGMWLVGEDLPQSGNGVTLHPTEKDQHGMPVPVVHFQDHPNDIAMRNHAYKAGTAVYQSLGATQVFELPPFPSTHNMGTCRQSEKAPDGVCNKYGQTHDIPNLFVSDGSQFTSGGAENPTLTIVALAIRQAEYLADQLSRRRCSRRASNGTLLAHTTPLPGQTVGEREFLLAVVNLSGPSSSSRMLGTGHTAGPVPTWSAAKCRLRQPCPIPIAAALRRTNRARSSPLL
jgi:hypothetical protein